MNTKFLVCLVLALLACAAFFALAVCCDDDDDDDHSDADNNDADDDNDSDEWTCRAIYDFVYNCCWWMMDRCGAGGSLITEDLQVTYCEQNQTVRGWDFSLTGPIAQCVIEAAGSCSYMQGCIGNHTPEYQCDDPDCTGNVCYNCFYDCHSDVGC
jgi:hypothetical protein